MKKLYHMLVTLAIAAVCASFALADSMHPQSPSLRILAPDFPATRAMQKIADNNFSFENESAVELVFDFIPWPEYDATLQNSLSSGEEEYNIFVSDNHWLGAEIEGGYVLDLTDLVSDSRELKQVFDNIPAKLLSSYSTYPRISAEDLKDSTFSSYQVSYYGVPYMPNFLISYYRTDLFCDSGEQDAFLLRYNRHLPCTQQEMDDLADWDLVQKIGEFFRRKPGDTLAGKPLDEDFFGIAYQTAAKGYVPIEGINSFIWQYGGQLWDDTRAPASRAKGVVNSDAAVMAFEHYLSLLSFMPPEAAKGGLDDSGVNEYFKKGKVAWALQHTIFAESLVTDTGSDVYGKVGFALHPGIRMSDGTVDRTSNIAGYMLAITPWSSASVTRAALEFIEWWFLEDTQRQFIQEGGLSPRSDLLATEEYDVARPWNYTVEKSIDWQKDMWNASAFMELFDQQEEEFTRAISGQTSAKEALDNIATFQDKLLRETGYIVE